MSYAEKQRILTERAAAKAKHDAAKAGGRRLRAGGPAPHVCAGIGAQLLWPKREIGLSGNRPKRESA